MSLRPGGFSSVVFDCDSTLAAIEGIDELAGRHREAVAELTDSAMAGAVPLEQVYGRRLDLIRPSAEQLDSLGHAYIRALVPDARETVAALSWLGKTVRIISGGLEPAVVALAAELGLRPEMVAAVGIRFDPVGAYAGYDAESPLSRSGGKQEQIRRWALPGPVLLVGDGATDAEARSAVDAFAAYTGVAFRAPVAASADLLLRDPSLAPVLAIAAGDADRRRLRGSPFARLLERGSRLLQAQPRPRVH